MESTVNLTSHSSTGSVSEVTFTERFTGPSVKIALERSMGIEAWSCGPLE